MEGVSGVTGAGPLLHRAAIVTAARYAPAALPSPETEGLVPESVCRVSGLLATRECPGVREWFVAGTTPTVRDTWVRGGRVRLPDEYGAWVSQAGNGFQLASVDPEFVEERDRIDPGAESRGARESARAMERVASVRGFQIVSPADGDLYRMPPGVPADYATVALRAEGATGAVRWFVDGVPHDASRWRLRPGAHLIRAVAASGSVTEVRIRVEE